VRDAITKILIAVIGGAALWVITTVVLPRIFHTRDTSPSSTTSPSPGHTPHLIMQADLSPSITIPHAWTKLDVTVTNDGDAAATECTITWRSKSLQGDRDYLMFS